jgi:filamentous hemagglutinin
VVATDGDLLVHGSQLDAQNDLWLQASRDVNLISALNTSTLDGQNESHGGSAGVGIGYGSGGAGISVSASVNGGKGTERGNGTTRTETTVNAGIRSQSSAAAIRISPGRRSAGRACWPISGAT